MIHRENRAMRGWLFRAHGENHLLFLFIEIGIPWILGAWTDQVHLAPDDVD